MIKYKYISWKKNITIIRSSNNRYLLYESLNSKNKFIINDVCFEIVTLCNGENRILDIVEKCVEKYKISYEEAKCNIIELLDSMEKEYQLELRYTDYPAYKPISIDVETCSRNN